MIKKHYYPIFFFIILLSCSQDQSRIIYEKGLAVYKSGDQAKYRQALIELDSIPYSSRLFGNININNPYYNKAIQLAEEIKADYVFRKSKELKEKYRDTKIAYTDGEKHLLYCMDFDGSNKQLLAGSLYFCRHPRWSPDGKSIAVESSRDIYIISYPSGKYYQVTDHKEQYTEPDWSPDGRKILFHDSAGRIFVHQAGRSGFKRVSEIVGDITSAVWLKNSRDIFVFGVGEFRFLRENSGKTVLYKNQPPEKESTIPNYKNLLAGLKFYQGTLSHDGNRIAVRNNGMEIINLEPFGIRKGHGNMYACWSPDDQYLMYSYEESFTNSKIVAAPVYQEDFIEEIPVGNGDDPTWSPRFAH